MLATRITSEPYSSPVLTEVSYLLVQSDRRGLAVLFGRTRSRGAFTNYFPQ